MKTKMPANIAIPMITRARCYASQDALDKWQPTNAAEDEATISMMDMIGDDMFGEGVTARRISAALRRIGARDVVVNINSPGGNFFEGLAIYNLLRNHKQKVTINVVGLAASAASFIAMAGDEVNVAQAGFLMIHNTQMIAGGDRNDLQDAIDVMTSFDDVLAGIYAARTGLDKDKIGALLDNETWLSGEAAVDQGFADALLAPGDYEITNRTDSGEFKAVRVVDTILAQNNISRSKRRDMLREIKGTPSAAENNTPDAVVAQIKDLLDFTKSINPKG